MKAPDVLKLVENIVEIYSVKGKRIRYLDLKGNNPSNEEILNLLLGPTGNLRAPTLRIDRTLVVGFDEETYAKQIL